MFFSSLQKGKAPRDAFLFLRVHAKRFVFLDHEKVVIDACCLLEGEEIKVGSVIDLPVHNVIVGERIILDELNLVIEKAHINGAAQ